MRSYCLEGIIIKRVNVGEADKILTLFTKESGKVVLKVKGVRKLQSKRAGSLELFNHVRVFVVKGRGSLDLLTEVILLNTFSSWRKFLGRVNLAYQLAEAVDKLTPENQSHPEIFTLLLSAFLDIENLDSNWKLKIENWLINLIIELGYWPEDKKFTGDIYKFIEDIISRPLYSPKILDKLR